MTQKDSLANELETLHRRIRQHAYELFEGRHGLLGDPFRDWLTAERELIWRPPVELRQKDDSFELLAATPGVEAKDLDVQITPEDVLIQADIHHRHTPAKGTVHVCEFTGGKLFRSIHFPQPIDPASARAEYKNGLLHVTAVIAKAQPRKVEIGAA
jgi:HSP20 family protein